MVLIERGRKFSLTSYLNEEQIKSVLEEHKNNIRVYAYILHDKDKKVVDGETVDKEPHTHILILTFNATTVSAVRRWFYGFVDSELKEINTLGQSCKDIFNMFDYFLHKGIDDELIHKYSIAEIKSNDLMYFLGSAESCNDNAYLMFDDMVKGVSFRTMAKKYGKDFIYHYSALRVLVFDYMREQQVYGDEDNPNRSPPFEWN